MMSALVTSSNFEVLYVAEIVRTKRNIKSATVEKDGEQLLVSWCQCEEAKINFLLSQQRIEQSVSNGDSRGDLVKMIFSGDAKSTHCQKHQRTLAKRKRFIGEVRV